MLDLLEDRAEEANVEEVAGVGPVYVVCMCVCVFFACVYVCGRFNDSISIPTHKKRNPPPKRKPKKTQKT